jgi:putative SOS response-associated peptidase YedK
VPSIGVRASGLRSDLTGRADVICATLAPMCGRYSMSDPQRCVGEFSLLEKQPALEPRYNIAPSQGVWVVRMLGTGAGRRLDLMHWGLVMRSPPATTKSRAALPMVRVESLGTRASFGAAFRSRRCLLLADGFYEWRRGGQRSFPYHFRRTAGAPFAMAGIWYPAPPGEREGTAPLDSCAVITRPARPPVDAVHDRMPAILSPEHHERWLDPDFGDTEALTRMLVEDPGFVLETVPVGPRVNSPANDDPSCVAPATDAERRGEQFDLWPRQEIDVPSRFRAVPSGGDRPRSKR